MQCLPRKLSCFYTRNTEKQGTPLGWSRTKKTAAEKEKYRETGEQTPSDLKHRRESQRNLLTQRGNLSEWLIAIQVLGSPGGFQAHE